MGFVVVSQFIFGVQFTPLKTGSVFVDTGLPGGSTEIFDTSRLGVVEDFFNFFKWLLAGLWEEEEHVDKHGNQEDTEDDVHFPSDVGECRRHEICQSEVEGPVTGSGERDSLSTDAQWVEFWWVDPGDWTPGWCVRRNEEVGAGNDSGCWRPSNGDGLSSRWELVLVWHLSISCQETSIGKHPNHHEQGTDKHSWATTPAVNPDQSRDGHDDIDDELNGGWKKDIASQASHGEDIRDVVLGRVSDNIFKQFCWFLLTHHNVHASKLGPDLAENTNVGTVDHLWAEKLEVGNIRVSSLELDDLSDLCHFLLDEWRLGIALCVNKSKHADRLVPAILFSQPSG